MRAAWSAGCMARHGGTGSCRSAAPPSGAVGGLSGGRPVPCRGLVVAVVLLLHVRILLLPLRLLVLLVVLLLLRLMVHGMGALLSVVLRLGGLGAPRHVLVVRGVGPMWGCRVRAWGWQGARCCASNEGAAEYGARAEGTGAACWLGWGAVCCLRAGCWCCCVAVWWRW